MKLSRFLWTSLGLLFGILLLWLLLAQLQHVAQRRDENRHPLPVIGAVADFALTNQNGQAVTLADLRGKVWIADIIFTRCPGPCLKMSRQMKELQTALPAGLEPKLVTLTTDTDFDTPAVLKAYAERFGADSNRWIFLTGDKAVINRLETNSLKQVALPKDPGERESANDLFVHSTLFVIVDRQSRLRGVFETAGDGVDFQQIKADILKAVRRLERET